MANKNRICLVSCAAEKRTETVAAKDLYISLWFRLARRYVESSGGPWFILSAKHGLLEPDRPISPYDETLKRMNAADRRAWAQRVISQLNEHLPEADEVAILAGFRYRQYLGAYLSGRFSSVRVPMQGLKFGEQLNWLKKAVEPVEK